MENDKKFYWIKLKTNFFSREDIDFLLSQKNGCEYVVLYQMLCLNTANNDGRLESKIGELLVPYNADKIVRDCKYFDIDTVNVAMTLYKRLGLIYEEKNDDVLKISNYDEMVGSETRWAEKKRLYRERKKQVLLQCNENEEIIKDNVGDNIERDKSIEYRDKSIEYRDIDNRDKNSVIVSVNDNPQNNFSIFNPTVYTEEKAMLDLKPNEGYVLKNNSGIPNGYQMDTQVRLGQDSIELGQDSIGEDNNNDVDFPILPSEPSKKDLLKQYESEFEKLWEHYPNKKGKEQAKNKFISARKDGTSFEEIANGLKKYILFIKAEKMDIKYIKHGSTWFNQKCWLDEYKNTTSPRTKNDEQWDLLKGVYNGTIKINK